MAKKELTFEELKKEIESKRFSPVYVLMGEEPYFIDAIEEAIEQNALNDDEREFNLLQFYGADAKTDVEKIIIAARQIPMTGERQLVVVKEAQNLNKIEGLSAYIKHPAPKTIFVICHKYKKIDGRKSLLTEAKKTGIVFESNKIYDNQMADFIMKFMKQKDFSIDFKAAQMLVDCIGTDISRLSKEADKLNIILSEGDSRKITPEIIEKNIGISKDYNTFELVSAVAAKNFLKACRIADYFVKNDKTNPIQMVLPNLYNFFANMMICIYAGSRSEREIMNTLKIQWSFLATDYVMGITRYNAMQCYNNIHEIRLADARSKGVGDKSADDGEIYKELLFKMMH
ncbi:MAG: DNA polymerase III subunit delta [Tannerella sp.]|jgi:DNA polymerase-3 subunit delta|nr:DNA polymerase III subunit delta [Tannerella sp.]